MRRLLLGVALLAAMISGGNAGAQTCPTTHPAHITPTNGIVPFGNVTFEWAAVANATSYELFTSIDGAAFQSRGAGNVTQKTLFISMGQEVAWKVSARRPTCPDMVNPTPSTFSTSCPDGVPRLVKPAPASTFAEGTPITFEWLGISVAQSYTLQVTPDFGRTWQILASGITGNSHTATLEAGNWGWTVYAELPNNCPDMYAEPSSFFIGCDNPAPEPLSPEAGVTTELPVTFSWSGVAGARNYSVIAVNVADNTPRFLGNTGGTSLLVPSIPAGTYDWKVVAHFNDCPDTLSNGRRITIAGGTDCPSGVATLIEPANGASNVANPVTFKWTAVENAFKYQLFVSIDGGQPFVAETTTDTQATVTIAGNSVVWTVQTLFENCPPTLAPVSRFSAASTDCPANPEQANLLSPANGTTGLDSPVTFDWTDVPNATSYRVIFTLFSNNTPVTLGVTDQSTLTADVPAGAGFWIVQTFFGDDCPPTLSDRFAIQIDSGATCDTAAPALLSPANGATNVPQQVTFAWAPVPDAIGYKLFVSTGGDLEPYGVTEETSIERFVPAGQVRWQVAAVFAGCPETRSSIFTFTAGERNTCPTGTINLLTPAEGATVSSPVRLAWSAINGAVAYRVWMSIDDEAPVILARTTELELEANLPAGPARWFIEALLPGDCEPILSAEGHFTIQQATNCGNNPGPALVSPLGTAENPAKVTNPVTLKWNAVTNAIAYRVWLSIDGEPFADIALLRETELTRNLPEGAYEWFAQALFNNCPPVDSAHAFFVIEATRPRCSDEQPVLISPMQGATETSPVTFSWSAVEGAVKYRLFGSVDGDEPVLLGATTDTELTRPLPPGVIDWGVEVVFDDCPSTFSARNTFTVARAQNCSTDKAQLVSPANGSTTTAPIDFLWNAVDGAVRYVLFARTEDGSATPVGETTETQLSLRPPPGTYEWWIVTFFRGCDPTESEHFTVNVTRPEGCAERKPIILLPRGEGGEVPSPVHIAWTNVPNATTYRVWAWQGTNVPAIVATGIDNQLKVDLPAGTWNFYVDAQINGCALTAESAVGEFTVAGDVPCGTPEKPETQVLGQALSNSSYTVRWTSLANVDRYELQEARSLDFSDAATFTVETVGRRFTHEVTTITQFLYRVRGVSNCNDERGPYSDVVGIFVIPPQTNNSSTELGATENIVQKIFLPGSTSPLQFMATVDKPWLTVTPASGNLPPEGVTLLVTANPGVLNPGTNTATVSVQYTGAAKGMTVGSNAVSSVPISVSLVTPVVPSGKGTPPPDALIIGAVGHATGLGGSLFESDIRVTNLSAQTKKYQINYTPSATDGTVTGNTTTIEIPPNGTTALDDIVSSLFGLGTTGSALGMLEIRPLTTSTSSGGFFSTISATAQQALTAASSRTYNFTPTGTFGQFIPAIAFEKFLGAGKILSLQQVAHSAAYRGNFGFLEASGNPVELMVRVYDTKSLLLATIPVSLRAAEHLQYNNLLGLNGINELLDGRVEVEVVSGTGKISAYVSEIDNRTNDPLLVSAVEKGAVSTNRWVVPGIAHVDLGFANWVSDMRVFNSGTTPVNATLTFYEQYKPENNTTRQITIDPGEIEVLDEVVTSLFQLQGVGGSVVLTTPQNAPLTVTARTYNETSTGTYGQFIPGVTVAESIGNGDRALQVLQVEQSPRFRTNIGLNETTGNPVDVEVSLIQSDSIVTPFITFNLKANEYRQLSVADFGEGEDIYNARVTVKAIGGTGKVTAYGASIDRATNDPTYIPAQ